METIRDGKGRGNLAEVNSDGKLQVRAISISQEHQHAEDDANSFVATFEHVVALSGTKEIMGYFQYNGEGVVVISRLGFNTRATGATEFYVYTNSTITSGGIDIPLYNTNAGSRYNIDASVTGTDEGAYPITYSSLGYKMWEVYAGYQSAMYTELDTKNALILTPGSAFTLVAKSANAGDKVGCNIHIFEDAHR